MSGRRLFFSARKNAPMYKRRRLWRWLLLAAVGLGLAGSGAVRWYQTTRPEYRLRVGREAVRRADFAAARAAAGSLEAGGHREHACLLRTAIALELDRPDSAVAELNRIKATELRLEGATLYGEWLVRHQAQPAEAERLFRFVLSERPDDLVAHRGLAAIYYDQGAWALAVVHLLRWAALDPRDGRPNRFAGLIYKDMDLFAPATVCYRDALRRELKPAVVQEVREELAECLVKQSQYAEALQVLRDCGPRAEEVPALIALRGDCLFGLGKPAEAEALLDRALRQHPDAPDLLRVRGIMLATAERPAEAAPLFERALSQDPQDITSRHQLALAYDQMGRRDEAAKHRQTLEQTKDGLLALTKLIQQAGEKPWDVALQRRLAEMCQQLGRPELARRWLRAAANAPAKSPGATASAGGK
jgi:tetratricopeptide (TPR) repeat protein